MCQAVWRQSGIGCAALITWTITAELAGLFYIAELIGAVALVIALWLISWLKLFDRFVKVEEKHA